MSYTFVSVKTRGLVGDGATSENAALTSLNSSSFPLALHFTRGTYRISANITITNHVQMSPGAVFTVDSGVTLTFGASFDALPNVKVFTGSGTVAFSPGVVQEVWAEWWGARTTSDDTNAISAARVASISCGSALSHVSGATYNVRYYLLQTDMTVRAPHVTIQHIGNTNQQLTMSPTYPGGTPASPIVLGNPLVIVSPASGNTLTPTLQPGLVATQTRIRWDGPTTFKAKQSATDPTTAGLFICGAQDLITFNQIDCIGGLGDGYETSTTRYGTYGLVIVGRTNSSVASVAFRQCKFRQHTAYGIRLDGWDSTTSPASGTYLDDIHFDACLSYRNGPTGATRGSNNQISGGGGVDFYAATSVSFIRGVIQSNQGPGMKLGPYAQVPDIDCWFENNNTYVSESATSIYPQFYIDTTTDSSNNSYNRSLGGFFHGVVDHIPGLLGTDNNSDGTNPIDWWLEFRAAIAGSVHRSGTQVTHGLMTYNRALATQIVSQSSVGTETYNRYNRSANGTQNYGPGTTDFDTTGWARSGVGILGLPSSTLGELLGGVHTGKGIRDDSQSIAYASTINPDPTINRNIVVGALTGNCFIGSAANYANGQYMTLFFQQASSGGPWTISWGVSYKTTFQVSSGADTRSNITLRFDGTAWQQIATNSGMPA